VVVGALHGPEHASRERILTQPAPAKIRESTNAVVLKHGSVVLLTLEGGDVPWELPHGLGLLYHDCRFLDGYVLTVNGAVPVALSSSHGRGFETRHELANPELRALDGGKPIAKDTVGFHRERLIRGHVLHERLTVRNFGRVPIRLHLELRFRARFEDIFVLKGFERETRGVLRAPVVQGGDMLVFAYDGEDDLVRTAAIMFRPAPDQLDGERAVFDLRLEPGAASSIALSIAPDARPASTRAVRTARPHSAARAPRYWLERQQAVWLGRSVEVRSSNALFDRVLRRGLRDLGLLRSRLGGHHYFAAGIPWFMTLFGRDAAVAAMQTLLFIPTMAKETLELLARYQAAAADPFRDAEPGKILHELRQGELARMGAIPQSPAYYGTVDATPLFLILLARYLEWSGDMELARSLGSRMEAALAWTFRCVERDGYLCYRGEYETGLVNQGWKDSGNAIVDADGSLARPPIALAEVQGYVYRAWRDTARVLRVLGDADRARDLDRRAENLRGRFERDFWAAELGCYVLALQAEGRPAMVASSNAGQVLWSGIASAERAAAVARRLLAPDMFSGWGIRTLSSEERAYNPIGYHLGTVWPHDNALIIAGFWRYGQVDAALRVFDALFEAAAGFRDFRLPELYAGYARRPDEARPVGYPVACSPQAWAAGAIPHALSTVLGLRATATEGRLVIGRPHLPAWLDWLEVRGLCVGTAQVDLRFARTREHGPVEVEAAVRTGALRVEHAEEAVA
jgi:glycogen debranching enzyme